MSKPKKQTPRSTEAEKEQRVNRVYELLVSGARRYQILQYASSTSDKKEDWKVTPRQVDSYIQEANALIAADSEFARPRELGRAIAALDDLYQRCLRIMDYPRALAVRRELNTLLGLHAAPAVQTVRIEGVDDAQLQVLADALAARGKSAGDVFNAIMQVIAEDANRS